MLEQAKKEINRALSQQRLRGSDTMCDYYPCHFEGQDCTWCYCPFYPCNDPKTGGRLIERKKIVVTQGVSNNNMVWSCIDCIWVHQETGAQLILEELQSMTTISKKCSHKLVFCAYLSHCEAPMNDR